MKYIVPIELDDNDHQISRIEVTIEADSGEEALDQVRRAFIESKFNLNFGRDAQKAYDAMVEARS